MPPLKNLKREQFCHEYIMKQGGNGKQAYLAAYGGTNEISAESKASRLLSIDKVRGRCLELLQSNTGTKVSDLINNLKGLTKAKRDIVLNDTIVKDALKDNNIALEANKTLFKLYGLLGQTSNTNIDARSINISYGKDDITELKSIVQDLKSIRDREDIISGKVNRGVG